MTMKEKAGWKEYADRKIPRMIKEEEAESCGRDHAENLAEPAPDLRTDGGAVRRGADRAAQQGRR